MPPGTNERPFPGMPDQAEGKGRFSFNDPSPYAGRPHRDAQPTPRPNPPPRPGPSSPRATHAAPLVLTQAVVQQQVSCGAVANRVMSPISARNTAPQDGADTGDGLHRGIRRVAGQ